MLKDNNFLPAEPIPNFEAGVGVLTLYLNCGVVSRIGPFLCSCLFTGDLSRFNGFICLV